LHVLHGLQVHASCTVDLQRWTWTICWRSASGTVFLKSLISQHLRQYHGKPLAASVGQPGLADFGRWPLSHALSHRRGADHRQWSGTQRADPRRTCRRWRAGGGTRQPIKLRGPAQWHL
jgi:hypothetical protein